MGKGLGVDRGWLFVIDIEVLVEKTGLRSSSGNVLMDKIGILVRVRNVIARYIRDWSRRLECGCGRNVIIVKHLARQ